MLKLDKLIELRSVILNKKANMPAFDMSDFFSDSNPDREYREADNLCGTSACIAGYAAVLAYKEKLVSSNQVWFEPALIANERLGIESMKLADELFYFYNDEYSRLEATNKLTFMIAGTLLHMSDHSIACAIRRAGRANKLGH